MGVGVGVSDFESVRFWRFTPVIVMISFSKRGFDEASKKWKLLKIKGHGATFTRLGAFGGDGKGGVPTFWIFNIYNLWSWLRGTMVSLLKCGFLISLIMID